MDILAARVGADPVEFRFRNLSDQRMRRVLERAAEKFAWKPAKTPSGRGVGVSCGIYSGTYMVTMAEVNVDKTSGQVKAKRIVFAHDQGPTVSPEGTRQQIEGAIIMGLGYALTEEVRFQSGEVLSRNFDTYEIPRYSWLPRIETVLIDNPEAPVSGCGEPPVINMGAVVANAIFDAVGIRLLQLPMTPERVLAALKNTGADA
jgi:CO/xanthine dehydrogenase Mo-binding subunit